MFKTSIKLAASSAFIFLITACGNSDNASVAAPLPTYPPPTVQTSPTPYMPQNTSQPQSFPDNPTVTSDPFAIARVDATGIWALRVPTNPDASPTSFLAYIIGSDMSVSYQFISVEGKPVDERNYGKLKLISDNTYRLVYASYLEGGHYTDEQLEALTKDAPRFTFNADNTMALEYTFNGSTNKTTFEKLSPEVAKAKKDALLAFKKEHEEKVNSVLKLLVGKRLELIGTSYVEFESGKQTLERKIDPKDIKEIDEYIDSSGSKKTLINVKTLAFVDSSTVLINSSRIRGIVKIIHNKMGTEPEVALITRSRGTEQWISLGTVKSVNNTIVFTSTYNYPDQNKSNSSINVFRVL